MPIYTYLQARYQQGLTPVRERIGEARWQQAWDAGSVLSVEEMIEEMLEVRHQPH